MATSKLLIVLVLAALVAAGCGGAMGTLQKGEATFVKGEVAKADQIMKPLETKTGDKDYPLVLLSMGSVNLSLGDYRQAEACFQAAVKNLEVEISGLDVAAQILKSETGRLYRGFPHEKVLAHEYLGLAYMQQDRLNEARIEFAKATEEDKGKEAGQDDDFLPVHYLDGLRALKEGDFQYARVSFRKVVELKPDFALGWYGLMRASMRDRDMDEAEEAWKRYESLTQPSERLAKDGSTPCSIFLLDVGWGPRRTPDPIVGEFALWNEVKDVENSVTVTTVGEPPAKAYSGGTTYFQASTTGGLGEDVKKKVVSVAAKQAVSYAVPCAGLFLKSEADIRAWNIAPGSVYFAAVPIPQDDPSTVEINAYDKKGKHLPLDNQVLYYLTGRPFDEAQVIYARLLPNADYRENL